jgi:hypothetical protein
VLAAAALATQGLGPTAIAEAQRTTPRTARRRLQRARDAGVLDAPAAPTHGAVEQSTTGQFEPKKRKGGRVRGIYVTGGGGAPAEIHHPEHITTERGQQLKRAKERRAELARSKGGADVEGELHPGEWMDMPDGRRLQKVSGTVMHNPERHALTEWANDERLRAEIEKARSEGYDLVAFRNPRTGEEVLVDT